MQNLKEIIISFILLKHLYNICTYYIKIYNLIICCIVISNYVVVKLITIYGLIIQYLFYFIYKYV